MVEKTIDASERKAGVRRTDSRACSRGTVFRTEAAPSIEPPMIIVCDPHGKSTDSLPNYFKTMETAIGDAEVAIAGMDKVRQTIPNRIGGKDASGRYAAGEAAMQAYLDVTMRATAEVADCIGADVEKQILRISRSSDEMIVQFSAPELSAKLGGRSFEDVFRKAWNRARDDVDLDACEYELSMPDGSTTLLDLGAFSSVLRYGKDMVIASHFSFMEPVQLRTQGSLSDAVLSLENREVPFFNRLPIAFRRLNRMEPEVDCPFDITLMKLAEGDPRIALGDMSPFILEKGTLVEVNLRAPESEARGLLPFIMVDPQTKNGTKKGWSLAYGGKATMSGLNTIAGKPRANAVLSMKTKAMASLQDRGIDVTPLDFSYSRYHLNLKPTDATRDIVKDAIRAGIRRMGIEPRDGLPGFEPDVLLMSAAGMDIREVRQRFALKSLGHAGLPSEILDRTDFLINMIENVKVSVQDRIFSEMFFRKNDSIDTRDMEMIDMARTICDIRRTLRDTEDFLWVLKKDETLPENIRDVKGQIEEWLFDFAKNRFDDIFTMLAGIMAEAKRGRPDRSGSN
ncbi:MAG: hypothetical protein V1827_01630 [Candidatus Micrarchaeota archaeon]